VLAIDNDGEVRVMRNAATVLAIIHYEHWRAGCPESGHVRFGGGPSEKDQHRWYLAGGLPYVRRLTRRWIAPAGGRGSGGGASGTPTLPERESGRGKQHGGKARNAAKVSNALPRESRVIR